MTMARRLAWALGGVLLIGPVGGAHACAICFSGMVVTMGQQVDAADQAVLALPDPDGRFRVVEAVKGGTATGSVLAEPVEGADTASLQTGTPLLLARNRLARQWVSLGNISRDYADWLRQVAATHHHNELTDGDWRERLAVALPHLEDRDPVAAQFAYGEFARAPYAALRSLRGHLDAPAVVRWTDDPALAARRATYTLLLGIAGRGDDMAGLEQRLNAAWQAHDTANLAAMIAADLEFRGPPRVAWVETMYLADRNRTLPELEAVLLALSVQGDTNGAVPRERIIQSYCVFMQQHRAMAAFVAPKMADWQYWGATTDYVALLRADAVPDPASRYAVVDYIERSPDTAAKAAVQLLDDSVK